MVRRPNRPAGRDGTPNGGGGGPLRAANTGGAGFFFVSFLPARPQKIFRNFPPGYGEENR